jgi:hypothetical protein
MNQEIPLSMPWKQQHQTLKKNNHRYSFASSHELLA